jgi:hypothetical protein
LQLVRFRFAIHSNLKSEREAIPGMKVSLCEAPRRSYFGPHGGTQDLTSTVTWTSDTPTAATINNTGLAKSTGLGTATITATSGSVSSSTQLTVTAAALVSIAINPSAATIPLGMTQQFTATGTFTDGSTQDVTQSGHWSSTVATVATISDTAGTAGLASTLGTGITTIGINSNGVSAAATLTVNPAALASIAISPPTPAIALGTSQQFTATGSYTDGSTQDVTSVVSWSSSDATVAIISNTGGQLWTGDEFGTGLGDHHCRCLIRLFFHNHYSWRSGLGIHFRDSAFHIARFGL